MASTVAADFTFVPKVWADHISAHFDRKMGLGQLAMIDRTLTAQPGETVNFPFYEAIGDAEEPAESAALTVDNLSDSSFSCTIKEVAKAVGIKRKALIKSAESQEGIFAEIQAQIARVHAEKVDKDLITLINTGANHTQGFTATDATGKATITNLLEAKVMGFGDKHDQAVAIAMHSLHFLDMMRDSTAGFLKADANDPFWGAPGFAGRLLGMALFVLDSMPAHADIATKKAYECYMFKANPFGIVVGRDPIVESDYDVLNREYIFAGSQWYGTVALHGKVSALDKRIVRASFVTSVSA